MSASPEDAAIADRLAAVRERIADACGRAGRDPGSVGLVGVSKRKPVEAIVAAVAAGLDRIGESYVQEAVAKLGPVRDALAARGLTPPRWHFVGQLQRNKARDVVAGFDCVESLDRASLARTLSARAVEAGRSLEALVQVNLSGEPQKGGVAPDALSELLSACEALPGLEITGLMTVPAAAAEPEASRPAFATLRGLLEQQRGAPGGASLRELSMGMSGDFEVAIEEGATLVRVGTAIFGPREKRA
ncbi:MAG: YggS family pyridoxal phosphate-dependent enzyme [Myxococcales bacterium]|nr:YggS family pyridoxal phosphate-dependent enzyme [Myxococcales bacterium]